MDKSVLECLIAALLDKLFERLQTSDRVEQVNIFLGEPLGIQVVVADGTSSRGGRWTITAEEAEQ